MFALLLLGALVILVITATILTEVESFGWALAENRRLDPMISSARREALRLLEQVSDLAPEVRLGQLLANLSYMAIGPTNEAIWDMEDEQLINALRQHLEDLSRRQSSVA